MAAVDFDPMKRSVVKSRAANPLSFPCIGAALVGCSCTRDKGEGLRIGDARWQADRQRAVVPGCDQARRQTDDAGEPRT